MSNQVRWQAFGNRVMIRMDNQTKEVRQKVNIDEEDFKATGVIVSLGAGFGDQLSIGQRVIIDKYAGVFIYEDNIIYKVVEKRDIIAFEVL